LKFQRESDEFDLLKADPFWQASRQKPKDASSSKWILYYIMRATTTNVRSRAGRYAVILDRLIGENVRPDKVATRIDEMGGIEAAYEAFRGSSRAAEPDETRHGDDADSEDEEARAGDDNEDGDSAGRTISGRPALRSSGAGDRAFSRAHKIDLDHALVVDSENDLLDKIRDVGARCREPRRFYLAVTVYPEDADGWVRVVGDQIARSSDLIAPERSSSRG
jgi:hypothetical protein